MATPLGAKADGIRIKDLNGITAAAVRDARIAPNPPIIDLTLPNI
jgi:hypothetical protein